MLAVTGVGAVKVTLTTLVHPFESVIVTVYVPAPIPLKSSEVELFDQLYV